jgi:hypothetical protein
MTETNTKRMHYKWLREQDACCNPIADWREIAEWAFGYFRRLGISMYEWTVPKDIPRIYANPSRIEKYLYDDGACVAWMNGEQFMISKCVKYGIDEYGEPDIYEPLLYGGDGIVSGPKLGPRLTLDECVPIWNNEDLLSSWDIIRPWVIRYAKTQAVRDNNLVYCNYPAIITVVNGKDLEAKYAGNVLKDLHSMVIQDGSATPMKNIDVLDFGVPYILDKLGMERDAYGNDALQAIGINVLDFEKKERVIQDEVNANTERIKTITGTPLELRKQAVEQIDEMFGVRLSVEKRVNDVMAFGKRGESGGSVEQSR